MRPDVGRRRAVAGRHARIGRGEWNGGVLEHSAQPVVLVVCVAGHDRRGRGAGSRRWIGSGDRAAVAAVVIAVDGDEVGVGIRRAVAGALRPWVGIDAVADLLPEMAVLIEDVARDGKGVAVGAGGADGNLAACVVVGVVGADVLVGACRSARNIVVNALHESLGSIVGVGRDPAVGRSL